MYRNLIKRFTASPVYQLRHLVAQALVAMVTREDMKSSLMSCLEVSISYSVNDVNVNSIHGDLLFVQKVLEYIARYVRSKLNVMFMVSCPAANR